MCGYAAYSVAGKPMPIVWTAPECFDVGEAFKRSDIWMLSLLMWETLCYCTARPFVRAGAEINASEKVCHPILFTR